ncbi:MAG: 5'-methylthioadenosine/adenosylhomocysteine nucleosidase [Deltaproteobacteria bacterium]|nr:MAG: 5'-methylthioadenosine/adenosylhomocysteine nucleosidase [Deltaproteobacteria bacterium]
MRSIAIGCVAPLLVLLSICASHADIGLIAALNSSLEQLVKSLTINQISKRAGREFYSGRMDTVDVVLVRSPMGKVNNAITAQSLLSHYAITSVISIAPAGSVGAGINIGDIVVATELYQHDFGTIKPYGFIWSRTPDGTGWDEAGYCIADTGLRVLAARCARDMKSPRNKFHEGVIVTGDQFISARDKKEWLFKKFRAKAVDMGAAAIAQVCYANRVPFCIVRIITDSPGVHARIDFEKSIPAYQSDIDIPEFVKGILQGMQHRR